VLTETAARWILILHTALGVAAVGAATHLVLWMRRYLRGEFGRHRAVRRFGWIVLALQLAAFTAGNVMYPTYKVEVRAAYLESGEAIGAERAVHEREIGRVAEREHAAAYEPSTDDRAKQAAHAAHWFDIKEHWIALGILVCLALNLVLAFWDPRKTGSELVTPVFALAVIVAGTVWLGAIIGVMTATWRAV
jgi:hypothetical protein